ncbi:hypothetical protein DFJ69_2582 [Thermomonospora umbrina]|uniref:Uncharacterized protein n=1 Tax=Thermomonospora umbrina TaxID=111806 RepID=A0A3D9SMG7_9ACTN|nr:hypothetical protein DFJ69_2582 [Thermomonospora umbrina]
MKPSIQSGPGGGANADVPGPDHDGSVAVQTISGRARSDAERAARVIQEATRGRWLVWYGWYTRRFWATPRAPYPWYGLMEAATPAGLWEQIDGLDARLVRRG